MSTSALVNRGTFDKDVENSASFALRLQCPVCSQALQTFTPGSARSMECSGCGFVLEEENGIFRCLPPTRVSHFAQFIRDYELVRAKEGRGSASADYYLELPFKDLSGRNSWQWKIRAKTWRHLTKHVLPQIERAYKRGCDVLDMGAGNCWLSYRMALRGHRPVAVDLLENDDDGLGAARHYLARVSPPFPRFQAEMDRLPFAADQFDIAIFNASFHYSIDYEKTLVETLRCLRRPGHLIVADSPFYSCEESGQKMLDEKRADFERRFGFRSDSIQSREFLTPQILNALAEQLGVPWRALKPWYGVNWALRPVKARLFGRREPAKFYLLWATVNR